MLNPSIADEVNNDPTVERCEQRARQMGFGGLEVCNLFAFIDPVPQKMKAEADPVGPDNDRIIKVMAARAGKVICGWGEHGKHMARSKAVLEMLHQENIPLYCLHLNLSGEPRHPLYIGYNQQPKLWNKKSK